MTNPETLAHQIDLAARYAQAVADNRADLITYAASNAAQVDALGDFVRAMSPHLPDGFTVATVMDGDDNPRGVEILAPGGWHSSAAFDGYGHRGRLSFESWANRDHHDAAVRARADWPSMTADPARGPEAVARQFRRAIIPAADAAMSAVLAAAAELAAEADGKARTVAALAPFSDPGRNGGRASFHVNRAGCYISGDINDGGGVYIRHASLTLPVLVELLAKIAALPAAEEE